MKPDVSFFSPQQQLRKAKGQLSGRRNSDENNEAPQCCGSVKRYPHDSYTEDQGGSLLSGINT